MGRDPREQAAGTIQHITARGDGGEPVFLAPDDWRAFVQRLGHEVIESDWTLLSYCLMTNHVHLVVELGAKGISTGMHRVLTGHSHRFNARHQRQGHVFGNRYHTRIIEHEEHLPAVFRYVAWNPCKAGLAEFPERWPWSAHRALLGLEPPTGGLNVPAAHFYADGRAGYRAITSDAPEELDDILAAPDPYPCRRAVDAGFTHAQIAHALGINRSSVTRRLQAEARNAPKVPGTFGAFVR